jgi:transcriptional regulator with GAF, ATPase, and Fis domain
MHDTTDCILELPQFHSPDVLSADAIASLGLSDAPHEIPDADEVSHASVFGNLLVQFARNFANSPTAPSDAQIGQALVRVCQVLALDACSLLLRSQNSDTLTEIFTWSCDTVDHGRFCPTSQFPSALAQALTRNTARVFDMESDNATAHSVAIYPLSAGPEPMGVAVFTSGSRDRSFDRPLDAQLRAIVDFLANLLARASAQREAEKLRADLQRLRDQLQSETFPVPANNTTDPRYESIIGKSSAIARVIAQAEQVAPTESIVLLAGETGTGKELFAQLIHDLSPRRGKPMIKVNCAALPPGLVESELFGRERGAYTGALTREIGRFELAHQSTIFLDELGELPIELQSKLLRVLQDGCFERVGNPKSIHVNVRVIAATNRDLKAEVTAGRFREDLYYRLNVFPIEVPPLRERPEDIPMLAWAFAAQFGSAMNKTIEAIPQAAMEALQRYPWPGNVRELRNIIERAVIVTTGPTLRVSVPASPASPSNSRTTPMNLQELERQHILDVLRQSRWRVRGSGGAAEILGLKPTTLEARMAKLGISRNSAQNL